MRGQPPHRRRAVGQTRIIPARAGPTTRSCRRSRAWPDHPRSCGANSSSCTICTTGGGSSPLVRGQRPGQRMNTGKARIIPARAGPTEHEDGTLWLHEDHPRSCGANVNELVDMVEGDGSSPLVRGQPDAVHQNVDELRIIPARAGPTRFRGLDTLACTDHPRSCGANFEMVASQPVSFGSSPLVRGQPFSTGGF